MGILPVLPAPERAKPRAVHLDFATLRRTEFARLDAGGHVYLDYTGAALYSASQIRAHHARLLTSVLGNPHSENPAALDSTQRMESARARVLRFFRADPAEYDLVFTANASAALRVVAESLHDRGVGEEGEDPHLPTAGRAEEGEHFVDTSQKLGPAEAGGSAPHAGWP